MRDRLSCVEMSRVLAANLVRLIGTTTQQEIADKVGISRSALNKILQGQVDPRLSTVQALADVLGVPIERLTEEEGSRNTPSSEALEIARLYDALAEPDYKAVVKKVLIAFLPKPPSPRT